MSDVVSSVEQIQRENSEREKLLRHLIASFSRGREFYSVDVVRVWQAQGDYWVDRQYAFGVVQRLLQRMEAEGVLKSRLARTNTGERRYYQHA